MTSNLGKENMDHTCGNCRFSENLSSAPEQDMSTSEEVRCGKYGSYQPYLANKVNDCMEWEPKKP